MNDLPTKLDSALKGADLDEAIRCLAFALADSVAFATDYEFDNTNNATLISMVQDAYKFCCTSKSDNVTVQ